MPRERRTKLYNRYVGTSPSSWQTCSIIMIRRLRSNGDSSWRTSEPNITIGNSTNLWGFSSRWTWLRTRRRLHQAGQSPNSESGPQRKTNRITNFWSPQSKHYLCGLAKWLWIKTAMMISRLKKKFVRAALMSSAPLRKWRPARRRGLCRLSQRRTHRRPS